MKKLKTPLLALMAGLLFFTCRKMERPLLERTSADIARFFELPTGTHPAVGRIAQKLQALHQKTGLVNQLIAQTGYALWDKALLELHNNREGRNTATVVSTDTIVYIPLALPNTQFVNAFIYARLGDSVQMRLYRGSDYNQYGFGNLQDTAANAEKLALQCMLLNHISFGQQDFRLLDDRLFADPALLQAIPLRRRIVHLAPLPSAQRGTFQTIQYEVCTNQQQLQCTSNHSCCPDGSCSACQELCWKTTPVCQTVSMLVFVDNGNYGTVNINNTGGGGSPGGPLVTNGPQPCNPTPLLDNGLVPCPLGDTTGWILYEPVAVNEVDYSNISDSCLRALIQRFNSAKHRSFIFDAYNDYLANNTAQHWYRVKYLEDTTLADANGLAIPGRSFLDKLPDGSNQVTIRLNPKLFQNTSQQWVAAVMLHELGHGIAAVLYPQDTTGLLQHIRMFDKNMPSSIHYGLRELFPGIDPPDAMALGMDGLSQAYMIDDPANPAGPQIIDSAKDDLALRQYGLTIPLAINKAREYRNGTLGIPFCQ